MNSPIKIAFFTDILIRDFDGACRTMYHIIDRLPEHVEVLFLCGVGPKASMRHEVLTLPTVTIPFNKTYRMALPLGNKGRMNAALDRFDPDIIHIASPSMLGKYGIEYGQRNGLPILSIYHTHFISYVEYYFRAMPFLISPAREHVSHTYDRFYNNCDRVLVPTKGIYEELVGYGIDVDRLSIWPRGLDHQIFNPLRRDSAWLKSIVGNDKPTLLFASRLVWEKNLKTLVKIYKQTKDRYNWIVAGDGVARESIEASMPKAHFLGKVDQATLAQLYASVDLFIFPSISETFGNVVTEALACGCPCIVANGGGTKEHIIPGYNGYIVAPNDAAAYAERIDYIVGHPELHQSMKIQSTKYTEDLDWDTLVDRYMAQVSSLAASKNLTAAS